MSVGMYVDYLLLVLPFCVGVNTDRIKTRKNASKPDIAQMALNKRPHTKLDFLSLLEILHTIKSASMVCTDVIVTVSAVQ